MKFLFSTLKNFLQTNASVAEICQKLTDIGLEVESCLDYSASLASFTVAEIISASPHPNSQKLQVCLVQTFLQKEPLSIVCGAPNARAGIKVAFAPIGSSIPSSGLVLKKAKIAGIESNGMLCSAFELDLGFESDGILEIDQNIAIGTPLAEVFQKNDALIELNITPNRGDCLGVYNIAKDLSATDIGELKPLSNNTLQSTTDFAYSINNLAGKLCNFIAFRQITNLQNQQSPQWLIDYLNKVGLNSVSAVVDCLNYTMHLFNQPMHAYDSANFVGEIQIKLANTNEQFTSLKQIQYTLKNTHLVVANQQKTLSLAGIMGGIDSSCTMQTNQVILEAASFAPENIATTGRELNIISDSRYRFERGIDSSFCSFALDFATNLILQICGGEATKIASCGQENNSKNIDFDYNLVKSLTNLSISQQEITNIFTKLGFIIENNTQNQGDSRKIKVPSNRFDINLPCDLVEEIARIYGYNQIPSTPLPNNFSTANINNTLDFACNLARKNLVACGFIETINWSFTSLKTASCFAKPEQLLELQNPISAEMQYLRPTLLTGLIANYQKNSAYSFFDCSLFEIGSIFANNQNHPSIALLQTGNNISANHLQQPRAFNVFDIKQNLLNLLEIFNLKPESLQLQTQNLPNYYHPHRSTAIFVGKKLLGYFGEIHPNVNQHFGLKNKLNVAEIFCQNLPEVNFNINHKAYQNNLLPVVERDFSFIAESSSFVIGDILKTITNTDKTYINQVILLDIFTGSKNLTNNQTSLTFRVKIKPTTQTLTTAEIEIISQKIIDNLSSNHQLTLRQF